MKNKIKQKWFLVIATVVCTLSFGYSQQVNKSTIGKFLLKNATLHTITQGTQQGDLLIEGTSITQIGKNIEAADAQVIDCEGKHIYPGFIDGGCRIGLAEIGAVSLTQDYNEIGTYTPHMRALSAVNPNSVHIPITRVNGVTSAFTYPDGGLFPGKGALIHMQGYTPEQMSAGFEGIILNWPSSGRRGRWDRRTDEEIEKDREKSMKKLKEYWDAVAAYTEMEESDGYKPQLSALKDVVLGKEKMIIEVNKKDDILQAIAWANENELDYALSGMIDGWRVIDTLEKYDIPVITGPVLSNPSRDSDAYDAPYANAGKMAKAGVLVALRTNQTDNVRNLPFEAAFAATYGLGVDKAVQAITINAAKIFGVDDKIGSLESGKLANLFICDGDPFEMKTRISHLFIQGWNIPLESRQTLLYDEFLQREPGLEIKK